MEAQVTPPTPLVKGNRFGWQPTPPTTLKDPELAQTIHHEGFKVIPFLNQEQLAAAKALLARHHELESGRGGMFYSLYSQDLDYRKEVHETLADIFAPSFEQYFHNHRNVINFFILKVPGPASEFSIHQDMSAVDENLYTPLSVWTALEDITEENGALCMMRYSHWFFSPYRAITMPFPFAKIQGTVRRYLEPVYLKAGESILFDPRILHNSLPNKAENLRPAVVSGIFPEAASLLTCYKDEEQPDAKIELLAHDDQFLLEHPNFMVNCHARPDTGRPAGYAPYEFPQLSAEEFTQLCELNHIRPLDLLPADQQITCRMIGEPHTADEPLVAAEPVLAGNGAPVAPNPDPQRQGGLLRRLFGKRR